MSQPWPVADINNLFALYPSAGARGVRAVMPQYTENAIKWMAHKHNIRTDIPIYRGPDAGPRKRSARTSHVAGQLTKRNCMCCERPFNSEGIHNRLCIRCGGVGSCE